MLSFSAIMTPNCTTYHLRNIHNPYLKFLMMLLLLIFNLWKLIPKDWVKQNTTNNEIKMNAVYMIIQI